VTGWFVLGGIPQEHFVYSVENTRDGRNYCVRSISVTQIAEKGVMFTCTCSFKRVEKSSVECQDALDLRKKYSAVLDGKTPLDHPDAPSQDSTW
jgi:acyl-CoA thioesterase